MNAEPRDEGKSPLLELSDVSLTLKLYGGDASILKSLDLDIRRGERVALVGESGCGKSLTAQLIMGLVERRNARVSGSMRFRGKDMIDAVPREWDPIRGRAMTMIFQDPATALNPVFTVADQMGTVALRSGAARSRREALPLMRAALEAVAITDPDRVLHSYPFQLSGGLNQRVMITMALMGRPDLILADEPGTALDVTVQAQTLTLMRDLAEASGTAVLLITHNLGVVREFAERVYVMYGGTIVETGPVAALFREPKHPYTRALIDAVPRLTGGDLPAWLEGSVPDYRDPPSGCRFHPRCPHRRQDCLSEPPVVETGEGHQVACVLYGTAP